MVANSNYKLCKYEGQKTRLGCLKRARVITTGEKVSVYVVEKSLLALPENEGVAHSLKHEVKVLGALPQHPNVAGLLDLLHSDKNIYVVRPLCSSDLFEAMQQQPLRRFSEGEARDYLIQILAGVSHIHENGLVHRNLKPENIMLKSGIALVSGFTHTTESQDGWVAGICGSAAYVAPEVISSTSAGYEGRASDAWSIGCLLYTLCAGYTPFFSENDNVEELFTKILKGDFQWPKHFSLPLRDLLTFVLVVDPDRRLSVDQIKNHYWIMNPQQSSTTAITSPPRVCSSLKCTKPHFCSDLTIEEDSWIEKTGPLSPETTCTTTPSSSSSSSGPLHL